MNIRINTAQKLSGKPIIPGDKSISHRSLLFGALAKGTSRITHLLEGGDVHSTWRCLEALGTRIERRGEEILVHGQGIDGFRPPQGILDCGNSGTTMRLLMGTLTGSDFLCEMTGDPSLQKRPMKRIAEPLVRMGAQIDLSQGQFAPLKIRGCARPRPIAYELPVASAQLKSAILLAGLFADGTTRISGKIASRDHTERLLPYFGVPLQISAHDISIQGGHCLRAADVSVPGDISSAAFWIAAATLVPGSELEITNVLLNPSRIGFLNALLRMGAKIETELTSHSPEPVGTLRIQYAPLKATAIHPEEVPSLIDELPLFAVLASTAEGITEVSGAQELRVKESDRIQAVATNLRRMGAEIKTKADGFSIQGPQRLRGALIESYDDHRIAMAFSIAALITSGETEIKGIECVSISYPTFFQTLNELKGA